MTVAVSLSWQVTERGTGTLGADFGRHSRLRNPSLICPATEGAYLVSQTLRYWSCISQQQTNCHCCCSRSNLHALQLSTTMHKQPTASSCQLAPKRMLQVMHAYLVIGRLLCICYEYLCYLVKSQGAPQARLFLHRFIRFTVA